MPSRYIGGTQQVPFQAVHVLTGCCSHCFYIIHLCTGYNSIFVLMDRPVRPTGSCILNVVNILADTGESRAVQHNLLTCLYTVDVHTVQRCRLLFKLSTYCSLFKPFIYKLLFKMFFKSRLFTYGLLFKLSVYRPTVYLQVAFSFWRGMTGIFWLSGRRGVVRWNTSQLTVISHKTGSTALFTNKTYSGEV
jgi:hypothetical protein